MTATTSPQFQDVLYQLDQGAARITINRPNKLNAFRPQTVEELILAFQHAANDPNVGVIVLSGAGNKAFCVGGDQHAHNPITGKYDGRGVIGLPVEDLHDAIRNAPQPVIARVNGYAIGGGNVLVTICDLAVAADNAVFGQAGPKVGSADPGFGMAHLARTVGEKRAREIWFLCRQYSAQQALNMGLVNAVVPPNSLDDEINKWRDEIMLLAPTAIAIAKKAFNADSEHIRGAAALGFQSVALYYKSDEAKEGVQAFKDKRKPKFRP